MAARPALALSRLLRECFTADADEHGDKDLEPPADSAEHGAPASPRPSDLSHALAFASPEEAGARLLRAFSATLAYRALCWHLAHFGARLVRECEGGAAAPALPALAQRLGAWLALAVEWGEVAWPYSVFTPGANPSFSPPLPHQLLAPSRPAPPPQPLQQPLGASAHLHHPAAALQPELRHSGLAYARLTPLRCVAAAAWPHHLGFLAAPMPMLVPDALCAPRGPRSRLHQSQVGFPHPLTAALMVARRCEDLRRSAPGIHLQPLGGRGKGSSSSSSSSSSSGVTMASEGHTPDRWRPMPQWLEDVGYEEGLLLPLQLLAPLRSPGLQRSNSAAALPGSPAAYGFFSPVPREEDPFASSPLPSPPQQQRSNERHSPASPASPATSASTSSPPHSGAASPSHSPLPLSSSSPPQQQPVRPQQQQQSRAAQAAAAAAQPPSPAALLAAGAAAHKVLWGAADQEQAQVAAAAAAAAEEAAEAARAAEARAGAPGAEGAAAAAAAAEAAAAAATAAAARAARAAQALAADTAAGGGLLLLPGQGLPHQAMDALKAHLEEVLFTLTPGLARLFFAEERGTEAAAAAALAPSAGLRAEAPQICVPPCVLRSPLTCALVAGQLAAACSSALTPTPSSKVSALLAASQALDRAIRLGSGSSSSAGADDLLPAQVWALLVGCPAGFLRVLEALEELVRAGATGCDGQGAYVLTTWRVAVEYVATECGRGGSVSVGRRAPN